MAALQNRALGLQWCYRKVDRFPPKDNCYYISSWTVWPRTTISAFGQVTTEMWIGIYMESPVI